MKGLSLLQPWASLAAFGHKRIETRSWSTAYRGELLIHASKKFSEEDRELALCRVFSTALKKCGYQQLGDIPRGEIIGIARLVDVRPTESFTDLSDEEDAFGNYEPKRFGWVLEDARPLPQRIPFKGALGLWSVPQVVPRPRRGTWSVMNNRSLRLANNLSLPLDLVTQTLAILAKRRAGKSYTMRRIIEQLFKADQQVVIVDPKGDQWGLRSAADGKSPGLPIVILGGERGDVPLEVGAGEIVAKLVVEERVSVLLDLSLFRKKEVAVFMADFLENLYRLKAREIYRTPVMLVVDEADAVAPQKPMPGEERMLGAIEDIVRRGGQRGIGCIVVTQRSAVLNKNVLTQAQILVALRTIAPQDLKAMKEWIDVHGEESQRKTLMESLPSLPVGEAWFWSPGWPSADGIFQRARVLPIETFDSGKSPEPGVKPVEPKNLADVDLAALKGQMAATLEKAKADDPRELRRQIADLNKQLSSTPVSLPTERKALSTPVLTDTDRALLEKVGATVEQAAQLLHEELQLAQQRFRVDIETAMGEYAGRIALGVTKSSQLISNTVERISVKKLLGKLATVAATHITPTTNAAPRSPLARRVAPALAQATSSRPARQVSIGDAAVGKSGLRRMLIALAQRPNGLTRGQLGVRAQVSSKGGSFDTYLSKARVNGWIDSTGERIQITEAGLEALGEYTPLPTGRDLLDHYLREFGSSGAARMLAALADAYPSPLSRAELSERSNVSAAGGSFDTYLSKLRTLELIAPGKELRLSEELVG